MPNLRKKWFSIKSPIQINYRPLSKTEELRKFAKDKFKFKKIGRTSLPQQWYILGKKLNQISDYISKQKKGTHRKEYRIVKEEFGSENQSKYNLFLEEVYKTVSLLLGGGKALVQYNDKDLDSGASQMEIALKYWGIGSKNILNSLKGKSSIDRIISIIDYIRSNPQYVKKLDAVLDLVCSKTAPKTNRRIPFT
ncbi:hypothetical protein ACFLZV_06050, partial [Candidatus Margulisiibacteriota bacterium]